MWGETTVEIIVLITNIQQVATINHGKICKYLDNLKILFVMRCSPELVQRGLRDAGNAGGHGHEEGRGAQRRVDRHHG